MTIYMTYGSEKKRDYIVLGRIGDVVISFKPMPIKEGKQVEVPGHTFYPFKLRASYDATLLESLPTPEVVPLMDKKKFEKPGQALPDMKWASANSERASTVLGVVLPGAIMGTAEDRAMMIKTLSSGLLAAKIVGFFTATLKDMHVLFDAELLQRELTNGYLSMAERIRVNAETNASVLNQLQESVGTVGVMADFLAKAKAAIKVNNELMGSDKKKSLPKPSDDDDEDDGWDGNDDGDDGDD